MKVSVESGETLRLLSNISGSKRIFAEIFAQAVGLRSGYQTLSNAIRAGKGMTSKQMEKFLHSLRHAEGDSNLADYKDDLRYMYYLLDYLIEAGVIDKDESMRIDAMTPTEERQMERRFGNGYEPRGDGNVEGLSDDTTVDKVEDNLDKEEEMVNVEQEEEKKENDVDDVLSQLLAFSSPSTQKVREETIEEEQRGDDFLSNFLRSSTETKQPSSVSVSSDTFDNSLVSIPDVFDRDSKKF